MNTVFSIKAHKEGELAAADFVLLEVGGEVEMAEVGDVGGESPNWVVFSHWWVVSFWLHIQLISCRGNYYLIFSENKIFISFSQVHTSMIFPLKIHPHLFYLGFVDSSNDPRHVLDEENQFFTFLEFLTFPASS